MHRPFRWGASDCFLAAADVYAALHGVDPAAPVRGYRTEQEADVIIQRMGGFAAMFRTLMRWAGATEREPRTGDLALCPDGAATGRWGRGVLVCVGRGAFASKGLRGVIYSDRCDFAMGPR